MKNPLSKVEMAEDIRRWHPYLHLYADLSWPRLFVLWMASHFVRTPRQYK